MLVILLILFPNVLVRCSDSSENKYVDLLPDKEKRQFMERVAKRILETVESREHNPQKTIKIPDEQLGYQDFVSSVLKEEIDNDNKRRSKGEVPKENRDEKAASQEKDNLDVKPLEMEKIADDPDLDKMDLTLRQDQERRGIGGAEAKSSDYINIELDIGAKKKPIIKRSVQNDTGDEDSVSDGVSSETSENVELLKTKKSEPNIQTSENLNSTKNLVENTTATFKLVDPTTQGSKYIESLSVMESLESEETEPPEHGVSKNNESENKDSEHIESTTTGSKNEEIDNGETKNNESSETDGEDIQVRDIENLKSRRLNSNSMSSESTVNSSESSPPKPAFEYFGSNLTENKSNEYNSDTYSDSDVEDFTTDSPDNTIAENIPTTQNIDESTEQSTPTINDSASTEYITKSTLTSTMTDEGTTNLETTTFIPSSEIPTTQYVESRIGPTRTTQEMLIVVEDFTSSTTLGSSDNSVLTTESISNSTKLKVNQSAQDSHEMTTNEIIKETTTNEINKESKTNEVNKVSTTNEIIKESTTNKVNKESTTNEIIKESTTNEIIKESTANVDEIIKETTTNVNEIVKETTKKPKINKNKVKKATKTPNIASDAANDVQNVIENTNQKNTDTASNRAHTNFIELGQVYYNNKKRKVKENEYRVFEIPANVSPFIDTKKPISEGPYFVPVYNYSSDNVYFNPTNRLGLNPDDDPNEHIEHVEHVGVFTIADNEDNELMIQEPLNDNIDAAKYDMDYTDPVFDNQRKKFGGKQKLAHSMHKVPSQNDSTEKKLSKVNPEDYPDSDYYFGRVRKVLKARSHPDLLPNELTHTTNLKDHVRAIRTMMFQQKFFGPIGRTSPEREEPKPKKKKLRTRNDNQGKNSNTNNNNIGLDYADFLGRMKSKTTTTIAANENDNLKKVGYVKHENNTKGLYMFDKFYKEKIGKYVHQLKSKDNSFTKVNIHHVTPKPFPKFFEQKKIEKGSDVHRFLNEAKELKPEPMKLPVLTDKEKKVFSIAENHKTDTVKKTVSIDKKDIFLDIHQMEELNWKLHRRNDDLKLPVYLEVLTDMITVDNKALKQYDWLGTTVDIQSALQKLFELATLVREEEDIHPADMEILNYMVFLHKLATEITEADDFGQLRKKLALPRNRKKKEKHRMLKKKGLIDRVWLYLRREVPESNQNSALNSLNKFLMALEDDLFDLHDAIKNIAKVTKYKNQHWYQNLKDLYLNADEKHLLELLLHLTVSRLFGLIEDSAKTGLEDDYVQYMKDNRKEARRTLEELLFVIQIMDEINKNVE